MNDQLARAFELFDRANAQDPNSIIVDGEQRPKELVFAERLTEAVMDLDPDASEALQLASRCQHIRRWEVPRDTQPMGRTGYLKWRKGLQKFHAETSAAILREVGYPEEVIERVQSLNQKKNLKTDADCQTLEDALCLVFLEHQFDDLIADTEEEKMIRIVQKTWAKMSPRGHEAAQELDYSPEAAELLTKALA
ncbi:DUF4202 domain-containing protein [Verrucomicrobiaceae bacterium 5K15]|uniref:DUF4202 domain-containing protein n=1 Tax=Oceaniferula flava TaxID=2800421 RepID=A0AAE2V8C7_9BACT|nr:DUF4202 domain-containing protein [Oceaniferula flavus]MBK1855372.1 DUF4202 domain-containing protein [Oceaniferula flavus]MBM1136678.1 DUF4202 domain-containing protein [Oceaniferula flavus]